MSAKSNIKQIKFKEVKRRTVIMAPDRGFELLQIRARNMKLAAGQGGER